MFDNYPLSAQIGVIVGLLFAGLCITEVNCYTLMLLCTLIIAALLYYTNTDCNQQTSGTELSDSLPGGFDSEQRNNENMHKIFYPSRRHQSTPYLKTMGASSSKKSNNENISFPGSPNMSIINKSSAESGVFGHANSSPLHNRSIQNNISGSGQPFLQHTSNPLSKQVLTESQNWRVSENPESDMSQQYQPSETRTIGNRLPRVCRHQDREPESPRGYLGIQRKQNPRRYPTHQAQYEGIGILPMVKLQQPKKNSLNDSNSSMLNNSIVTVKVAPPDVLKPPPPVFVPVMQSASTSIGASPSTSDSVISALREKRKRTIKEDGEIGLSPSFSQTNKRRRPNVEEESAEGTDFPEDMELGSLRIAGQKRPALSPDGEKGEEGESKRCRQLSTSSSVPSSNIHNCSGGTRNPIDVSFSSSKRFLDKQTRERSLNMSRESSISREIGRACQESEATSRSRTSSGMQAQGSRNSSFREAGSSTPNTMARKATSPLEDLLACSATSTPVASCSGRSTPASLSQDEQTESRGGTPKRRPLLLKKKGSTKRRLAPLPSDVAESLGKIPQLKYTLTVEELERDRQAERERILQTLDEVEEEHRAAHEKKDPAKKIIIPASRPEVSLPSSSVVTTTTDGTATVKSTSVLSALQTTTSSVLSGTTTTSVLPSLTQGKPAAQIGSQSGISLPSKQPEGNYTTPSLSGSLESGQQALKITNSSTTTANTVSPFPSIANTSTAVAGLTFGQNLTTAAAKPPCTTPSLAMTAVTSIPSLTAAPTVSLSSTAAAASSNSGAAFKMPSITSTAISTSAVSLTFNAPAVTATTPASVTVNSAASVTGAVNKPASSGFTFGAAVTSVNASNTSQPSHMPASNVGGFSYGTQAPAANKAPPAYNAPPKATVGGFSFGTSIPTYQTATKTSNIGGFNFGPAASKSQTSTTSQPANIFGQSQPNAVPSMGAFGQTQPSTGTLTNIFGPSQTTTAASTNTASTNIFGHSQPTTAASANIFGQNQSTPSVSTNMFGQSQSTAATASTGIFGKAPPTTSGAPVSAFGQTQTLSASSGSGANIFKFGGGAQTSSNAFGSQTPTTAAPAPAFGQAQAQQQQCQSASSFSFGLNKSATTPAFGTSETKSATPGVFQFGTAPTSKPASSGFTFSQGSSQQSGSSALAFGSGASTKPPTGFGGFSQQQATSNTTPAFGQANTQQATPSFGSTTNAAASPFGAKASSNPFGVGASTGNPSGTFGQTTTNQAAAKPGFDFSGATKPAAGGFSFGTSGSTLGRTASAPSFGSMIPSNPQPALPFQPSTPEQQTGSVNFVIGAGSTAPRRTTVRGARRRGQSRR